MDIATGNLNVRPARSEPGPHHVIAWRATVRAGQLRAQSGECEVPVAVPPAEVVFPTVLAGPSISTEVLTSDGWKGAAPDRYAGPPLRAAKLNWETACAVVEDRGSAEIVELRDTRVIERRRFAWGDDRWLDVLFFDVGDAIAFGDGIVATADPFTTRLAGQTIESRFLSLDMAHSDELASFFNAFGAPPDLGFAGDMRWPSRDWSSGDGRWISLARLRQLRAGLDEALSRHSLPGADWRLGLDARGQRLRPSYGQVRSHAGGRLLWRLDLWEAISVALASDLERGAIGFCEAPIGRGSATRPCGRPLVVSRVGRRLYCSERCHTRAGTRAYKLSVRARRAGQATTGTTPNGANPPEV